jgi:hypothetical protein
VNEATRRRIRVLRLRIRLERVATDAFDRVCAPSGESRTDRVRHRLVFLLDGVPPGELGAAHRTIRLARHVYGKTSEVIHGRYGALDLSDALLAEWEAVVDALEALPAGRAAPPPAG